MAPPNRGVAMRTVVSALVKSAPPVGLAVAGLLAVTAMTFAPPDKGPVAALFAPSLSRTEVMSRVAAADAALIRHGLFDGIVVAAADDPGLAQRLRNAGAWIVVDPLAIGACL